MGPKHWYCRISGNVQGPFSGQELAELAESGQLRRSDEVRKNADGEWVQADNVVGLRFGNAVAAQRPEATAKSANTGTDVSGESGPGRTESYWDLLPGLARTPRELQAFWLVLGISVVAACWTILANPPTETGWWLFQTVSYPYQMLVAVAFLIASGYLFLLSKWYSRSPDRFRCGASIQAFLLCGGVSILLCVFIYPAWTLISTTEVKGWFVNSVEYRNSVFAFVDKTGIIAGPVEEAAKLIAIMLVAPVRRLIKDRQSGLYYVTLCAFGFAMIENIKYFNAFEGILYFRANPAHAVFSSVWGAALGSWMAGKMSGVAFTRWLVFGMVLHSLWNLLVGVDLILFAICFVFTSWMGLQFIRDELRGKAQPS